MSIILNNKNGTHYCVPSNPPECASTRGKVGFFTTRIQPYISTEG